MPLTIIKREIAAKRNEEECFNVHYQVFENTAIIQNIPKVGQALMIKKINKLPDRSIDHKP